MVKSAMFAECLCYWDTYIWGDIQLLCWIGERFFWMYARTVLTDLESVFLQSVDCSPKGVLTIEGPLYRTVYCSPKGVLTIEGPL